MGSAANRKISLFVRILPEIQHFTLTAAFTIAQAGRDHKCKAYATMVGGRGNDMNDTLMTVLQDVRDLPALINAGADTFLAAPEGYSFTALRKMGMDELTYAARMAEGFGKRISVLANRLFHEEDIAQMEEFCRILQDLPLDYVVFQDPGFCRTAMKYGLQDRLIYMPDTLVTSRADVRFWKDLHVIPAVSPLLTLTETTVLAAEGGVMITVHGRTLLSRSGRPLLSAWKEVFDAESEVRKKTGIFLQEEKRDGKMPVWEDECGTLIYHDEILTSFHEMPEIGLGNGNIWFADGVFLERKALMDAVHGYRRILDGGSADEEEKNYCRKYGSLPLGKGYYYEKTVR